MNGYRTRIFEMHDLPGGLCTAWKAQGCTIDGCVHWLVSCSPQSGMYRYFEQVGIAQGRESSNMDEYRRCESANGRTLISYTNVNRLEKHLPEFSPQDAEPIQDFIQGVRMFLDFDQPSDSDPPLKRLRKGLKLRLILATKGRVMPKWMNISARVSTRRKGAQMRRATRIIAASFGVFAGFGGLEHGYFEVLQGNVRPESIMIASMGAPCVPEEIWNACEPAMTIIPSFLVTGILAIVLGLMTMVWATAFVQRQQGGTILALLSFGLLLFGGGIFPPVIGIIGGAVGTSINTPLKKQPGPAWRILAKVWPWAIVVFFVWLFAQFVIGYFFNEFLMENAVLIPILILGLLVISILAGYGHDIQKHGSAKV